MLTLELSLYTATVRRVIKKGKLDCVSELCKTGKKNKSQSQLSFTCILFCFCSRMHVCLCVSKYLQLSDTHMHIIVYEKTEN